ncbi:MAG: hypothetical protein M3279_02605 [Actinomycetota bacterium]|nr:hypothetical protein [Actinomycetota bacterium]
MSTVIGERITQIKEANKLEEANNLVAAGWHLFAALPMRGPSTRNQPGVSYVKYVLVRRTEAI